MWFVISKILPWTFALLYVVWFALSVFNQFSLSWMQSFRQRDGLHLLPRWTFFAPNPGTSDYHLVVRLLTLDGRTILWEELLPPEERPWWTALWNPRKRYRKCLTDCVQSLGQFARAGVPLESMQLSIPYLVILNFVVCRINPQAQSACQFAVLETKGFALVNEPTVIFCSGTHSL